MARMVLRDRAPANPPRRELEVLKIRRGEVQRATYDESKRWLWEKLKSGDIGIANALLFWKQKRQPRGLARLPKKLDQIAILAAAKWVRANKHEVRRLILAGMSK